MKSLPPSRDPGFIAIIALVAVNAVWLLLMPWVPAIASATLYRFHLRTSSFAAWAIQFPIPAMYNFANRAAVSEYPPGLVDPILSEAPSRCVNHFPTRVVTFGNARYQHLHQGRDRWFTLQSSYRGQTLETRLHLKPIADGGFEVVRLDKPEPRL